MLNVVFEGLLCVMLDALTKSLEAITAADLKELTERGWPESENVEYKAELHRDHANRQDPECRTGRSAATRDGMVTR